MAAVEGGFQLEGEASVQQASAPEEVASTTTSISQALSMTTPRSTKIMSEKFGISQPDTDVRALLINPAKWAESLAFIDTIVEVLNTTMTIKPTISMYMRRTTKLRVANKKSSEGRAKKKG